jgi:D-lactate dehydrogenase
MAFASKGYTKQGLMKALELEQALIDASENGRYPILVDMSPCLLRMKETIGSDLKLYDQIDFALEFLVDRLTVQKTASPIAVHATCSTTKMRMETQLVELAKRFADSVVVPREVECCGWAGDRGFTVPELNQSALAELRPQIPESCHEGFSTSRTCEIGLSLHGGVPYRSIFHLIDECSVQKPGE